MRLVLILLLALGCVNAGHYPAAAATSKAPVAMNAAEISLRHQNPRWAQLADARRVFAREQARHAWWVAGTEVSPQPAAREHGFAYFHEPGSGELWLAVGPAAHASHFSSHFTPVIHGVAHRYPTRGVLRVSFATVLGLVTVLVSHYNLRDRVNRPIARVIGYLARKWGAGGGLVFFAGDTNMRIDLGRDPFFGRPLTCEWTRLHHFEPTHYYRETIDTIAGFDGDGRPRPTYIDSRWWNLHSDHLLVEGGYAVAPLSG